MLGASFFLWGVQETTLLKKKERKLLPNSRTGGGAGCSQITPLREKEEGSATCCCLSEGAGLFRPPPGQLLQHSDKSRNGNFLTEVH